MKAYILKVVSTDTDEQTFGAALRSIGRSDPWSGAPKFAGAIGGAALRKLEKIS